MIWLLEQNDNSTERFLFCFVLVCFFLRLNCKCSRPLWRFFDPGILIANEDMLDLLICSKG